MVWAFADKMEKDLGHKVAFLVQVSFVRRPLSLTFSAVGELQLSGCGVW
jgi:hypothetical protein